MNKQYIEFKIEHQRITRTDDFFVVGGSKNYLHAKFCFCDDWTGEQATAVFSANGRGYTQLIENGECCVPWEVLRGKNFFVGCMAGELITSNAAEVKVCPCGVQPGAPGVDPTPSAYEQIISIMEETKEIAQSVRDDADNGEFDGDPGPKGDPGAIKFVVVTELPASGDGDTIYLLPNEDSPEGNLFDEYIFVDGKWEKIGSASVAVNLDEYVKKTDAAELGGELGLVKLQNQPIYTGITLGPNRQLCLHSADSFAIDKKTNYRAPITPYVLDHAVKVGVTTNTETLTEEEKAAAAKWLGVGDVWEFITEVTVEGVVQTEIACSFDEYRKVNIIFDGFGTAAAGRINAHFGYADSSKTKQICQVIATFTGKRYGYISVDTITGQITYTGGLNWAQAGGNLMTTFDSMVVRNHIGATKVIVMAIDSAGGGANPSASNTMNGTIKLMGLKK